MKIVFFGSFQHYSAKILEALANAENVDIQGVVTTPDSPVAVLAKAYHLPVFTPDTLDDTVLKTILPCDFFVTAGYGKLLPPAWLKTPKHGSLNLHFSLLPKYRGANPAEWAILMGETQTGITLITMSPQFDTGEIVFQKVLKITPEDTRVTVYEKLYRLGADELPLWLNRYYLWLQKKDFACQTSLAPVKQPAKFPPPYAKRFKKDDGFIDWRIIEAMIAGAPADMTLLTGHLKTAYDLLKVKSSEQVLFIMRAVRALTDFPSLWTKVNTKKGDKRMKIIRVRANNHSPLQLVTVQLEGYNPSTFNQIKNILKS